jgi:hypothetical protein
MKGGWMFAIGLLVGAVCGGAAGCVFMKQKYSQIADEEIASVMARYSQEMDKHSAEQKAETAKKAEEALKSYSSEDEDEDEDEDSEDSNDKSQDTKGRDDTASAIRHAEKVMSQKARKTPKPYVIEESVFNSANNPHKRGTLYYFLDGAITNDNFKPLSLEDIDELVGRESLTYFSDDTDIVFVRNEALSMDYEIVMQGRNYAELLKEKSYLAK